MKTAKHLFPFVIVSGLHLIALTMSIEILSMVSKPLIILSLIYYFNKSVVETPISKLVIFALGCSLIGDAALMFQNENETLFMVGLGFFLLAHVGYAFINFNLVDDDQREIKLYWQDIPLIIIGFAVFLLIKDGLGNLQIPVLSYIVIISFMAITARQRYKRCDNQSFWLIMTGALFFVLSDTLLAIDKFLKPIEDEGFLIMSTYIIAQFLIIRGIIVFIQKIQPEAGS
jgi:uncharacterized membrane protein YhhN